MRRIGLLGISLALIALLTLGSIDPRTLPARIPEVSRSINQFSLDLLKHKVKGRDAQPNVVLSPQSIYMNLAMSYIASGGTTRREMAEVLHFPDDNQQLIRDLGELRRQHVSAARDKRIDLKLAQSAWLDDTYADFRHEYMQQIESVWEASLYRVRFKKADRVSTEINRWVGEQTGGRIRQVVRPDDFVSRSEPGLINEPALVTISALHFKADWGSRFDRGATSRKAFHTPRSAAQEVDMMHQHSLLNYSKNEFAQFVEIPYYNDHYSMYILLPMEVLSPAQILDSLTMEMILDLKYRARGHKVDLYLPKFEVDSQTRVRETLAGMGMKDAFDRQKADFDRMIHPNFEAFRVYISEEPRPPPPPRLSTILLDAVSRHPPQPARFVADRPFLFLIMHNPSMSVLLAGWFSDPA